MPAWSSLPTELDWKEVKRISLSEEERETWETMRRGMAVESAAIELENMGMFYDLMADMTKDPVKREALLAWSKTLLEWAKRTPGMEPGSDLFVHVTLAAIWSAAKPTTVQLLDLMLAKAKKDLGDMPKKGTGESA